MGYSKRFIEEQTDGQKFMKLMDLKPKTYTIDEVVNLINTWSMTTITKEDVLKFNDTRPIIKNL